MFRGDGRDGDQWTTGMGMQHRCGPAPAARRRRGALLQQIESGQAGTVSAANPLGISRSRTAAALVIPTRACTPAAPPLDLTLVKSISPPTFSWTNQ